MWLNFLGWLKRGLAFARQVEATQTTVEQMRHELDAMSETMTMVLIEIQRLRDSQEHLRKEEELEREKMLLRLENELLKFERRLPQPKNPHNEE